MEHLFHIKPSSLIQKVFVIYSSSTSFHVHTLVSGARSDGISSDVWNLVLMSTCAAAVTQQLFYCMTECKFLCGLSKQVFESVTNGTAYLLSALSLGGLTGSSIEDPMPRRRFKSQIRLKCGWWDFICAVKFQCIRSGSSPRVCKLI